MRVYYEVEEKVGGMWEPFIYHSDLPAKHSTLKGAEEEVAWAKKLWPFFEFRIVKVTRELEAA